ncbi:MAG: hypothetical protein E6I56_00110 [Chloroflexi bacterium]|nr:MAG: hypothetical protein E6I56_00110 [Chloroflexota bacterium]
MAVGLGEGQGVLEAALTAVAVGVAEAEEDALLVAAGDAVALVDGELLGLAEVTWAQTVPWGTSSVWLPGALAVVPPRNSKAAGTTNNPRMTVTTKASAPHSWSQKPPDELRIRARRPVPAEAYSVC